MEMIRQLGKFTRTVLILGLVLVLYGYLCRLLELYFFWESKSIGWAVLFIGIIAFLSDRIKIKKTEEKQATFEKIGIGLIVFVLLVQAILITVVPFTNAYSVAKSYLTNNADLRSQLGNINGFGLIPTGSIQKTTGTEGEYGSAAINLTVKGDKKFKDITVYVVKYADRPEWEVEEVQY